LISKADAAIMIDHMIEVIGASWCATAHQAGVSERDCELIRSAFVYEGFGYDLNDPTIATNDPAELPSAAPRM
jgi:serine/threonine-protein kinase HipA